MATEYVCSGCGHTFRAAADPTGGCPACGAGRQRLWSVGTRETAEAPPRAPGAAPAAPPPVAPPPVAAEPARTASPRRPWWRLAWPFGGWQPPEMTLRLPAWRRPTGLRLRPDRRAAALAVVLALWPFPLDDDRLPTPPQSRTASGAPIGAVAAGGAPTDPPPVHAASTGSAAGVPPAASAAAPGGSVPVRPGDRAKSDAGTSGAGRSRGTGADGPDGTAGRLPEQFQPAASSAGNPAAARPPAGLVARPTVATTGTTEAAGTVGRSAVAANQTATAGQSGGGAPGGLSPSAGTPSAATPAAGAPGGGTPGGGAPGGRTPAGDLAVASPPPPACLGADVSRLVFVIDVSVSMGLPHGTDLALENRLDEAVHRGDAEALAQYRALLAQSGSSSRLELARGAFGKALAETPDGIEVGVVSFHGCGDVRRLPLVTRAGFSSLVAGVAGLMWHRGGETALSQALREAYAMNAARTGRIAVITDGKDTCGPPPCQIIEGLRAANPGIRVDVVDVSGRSDAACLALATGGTFRVAPLSGSVDAFVGSVTDLGRACPAPR